MKCLAYILVCLFVLTTTPLFCKAEGPVRHDIKVVLYPKQHSFTARDTVTLPGSLLPKVQFLLHKQMAPTSPTPHIRIVSRAAKRKEVPLESFSVTLPPGQNTFVLEYGGRIHHPLESNAKTYARGFSRTPGIISEGGIYLAHSSFWYPVFDESLLAFSLRVELPAGWDAVSQGERTQHVRKKDTTLVRWESPELQDEIFLVAARFAEYTQDEGRVLAMVFLRKPDKKLADKYLAATSGYIEMYDKLIGPYPYKKFALVENFWETGFGMPSFTLLGPKVIRFPFIINSSYPHEILHNWWGNSVFPDYRHGNWAEGLTAYLSDYLIKEQQGRGLEYRRTTLQKYADYVLSFRDFPLSEFKSRHSAASEAVGYGKALMFFHMLRRELGDKTFIAALKNFYHQNKFKFASFADLKTSFQKVSGDDLGVQFDQWITRTGAPQIKLSSTKVLALGDGYALSAVIEQVQPADTYHLRIPVAVTMEKHSRAFQKTFTMDKKRLELKLRLPARPLRLDVDPEFDVFRKLAGQEIPSALSQALGAEKMLIILPASAAGPLLQAYREFAETWGDSGAGSVEIKLDKEVSGLPSDRAVTVLGWENRFLNEITAPLSGYDVAINRESVGIAGNEIPRKKHCVVLTAKNPQNEIMAFTLVAADLPQALPGLGRKLPHYHKYSYLGFKGVEPVNMVKGRFPVLNSPMSVSLPGKNAAVTKVKMGELAPRQPLAAVPSLFSKKRMMETIKFFSGAGFATGVEIEAVSEELDSSDQKSFQLSGQTRSKDGRH